MQRSSEQNWKKVAGNFEFEKRSGWFLSNTYPYKQRWDFYNEKLNQG